MRRVVFKVKHKFCSFDFLPVVSPPEQSLLNPKQKSPNRPNRNPELQAPELQFALKGLPEGWGSMNGSMMKLLQRG